jgi:hypothetical protein
MLFVGSAANNLPAPVLFLFSSVFRAKPVFRFIAFVATGLSVLYHPV